MDIATVKQAAVVAVTLIVAAVAAIEPSVYYIQSPSGNFFRAPGKTMPDAGVTQTKSLSSICESYSLLILQPYSHSHSLTYTRSWIYSMYIHARHIFNPPMYSKCKKKKKKITHLPHFSSVQTGECKNMCFVSLSCLAWSVVTLADGTSECRLADAGPLSYQVENNTQATYFFKEGKVNERSACRQARCLG